MCVCVRESEKKSVREKVKEYEKAGWLAMQDKETSGRMKMGQ